MPLSLPTGGSLPLSWPPLSTITHLSQIGAQGIGIGVFPQRRPPVGWAVFVAVVVILKVVSPELKIEDYFLCEV